jgi:hypothetical protein
MKIDYGAVLLMNRNTRFKVERKGFAEDLLLA